MASVIELTAIAGDSNFQARVQYHMVQKALEVAAATPTSADMPLIQRILDLTEPVRPWCIAAVCNATIAAATYTLLDGSEITDGDLQYQIYTQWAAFLI
jgi:hypothetical protein